MAKQVNKLTAKQVQLVKPSDKAYRLSDGAGLSLYITKTGAKNWHFRYTKPSTKKPTYLGLGAYPTISLAEARDSVHEYKKMLSQGLDPQIEKEKSKAQAIFEQKNTLKAIAEDWYTTQDHIEPKTLKDKKAKLRMYVFPFMGDLPITEITAPLAKASFDNLARLNKLSVLHRTLNILNGVMNHAVVIGAIYHNPIASLGKAYKAYKPQNRASLTPEELPQLLKVMARANISYLTRLLFEWQLHTMVRPGEAVTAEWSEIDIENSIWTIPANKMKMRRDHKIPLTSQALAILEDVEAFSVNNGYIFPSRVAKSGHVSKETLMNAIKRTSLNGKQTAHGLRSLASTTLNEQGFNADIIEKALAHEDSNQVRGIYNRAEYLERRRKMMEWWSNHIDAVTRGVKWFNVHSRYP